MKFEEQFPSFLGEYAYTVRNKSENNPTPLILKVYSQSSIAYACMDKQKFLDALDKLEKADNPYKRLADQMSKQITNAFFTKEEQKEYAIELKTDSETRISISELKKELGL